MCFDNFLCDLFYKCSCSLHNCACVCVCWWVRAPLLIFLSGRIIGYDYKNIIRPLTFVTLPVILLTGLNLFSLMILYTLLNTFIIEGLNIIVVLILQK